MILPVYLTLPRLHTLSWKREARKSGTGSYPMENPTKRLTRVNSPGCVGRMSRSPSTRQGTDLAKRQGPPEVTRQKVDGPVASLGNPKATQRHKGANDETNPTITTGTASYMGVSGRDHHHRLESAAYMGKGRDATTMDTTIINGSGRQAKSTTYGSDTEDWSKSSKRESPKGPPKAET